MTKYHINPETGNPNVCAAKVKCKFTSADGVTPPHYDSKEAAIKAKELLATKEAKPKIESAKAAPENSAAPKKEKPAEVKVDSTVEDKPKANPVSSAVEKVQEVAENSVTRVATILDDELRGSEKLEKVIKFARKLDNSIALKLPVYRAKLNELRKKASKVIELAPMPKVLTKARHNG